MLKEELDSVVERNIAETLQAKVTACAMPGQEDTRDVQMNNGYRRLVAVKVKVAASILANVVIAN